MAEYTYNTLAKMCQRTKKRIETKEADQKEKLLAIAAAHTIDFLDLAKDNHIKLDLTSETEDNIPEVIMKQHLLNTKRRMSSEDSLYTLVDKLGGYELFTIFNGIAALSPRIQFEVSRGQVVLSYENEDGSKVQFDVYKELEKALRAFRLSSYEEEFCVFGTLDPFYKTMTERFLMKLK